MSRLDPLYIVRMALAAVLVVSSPGCDLAGLGSLVGLVDPDGDRSIDSARPIAWNGNSVALEGELTTAFDVDVFDLGPLPLGTRLAVEVTGEDGLDPVAAVFDAEENRLAFADDIDFPNGRLSAVIDEIIRRPSARYFLAVAGFGISPKPGTSGPYRATVTQAAGTVPAPEAHTVVIRFGGGQGVFVDDEILGRLGPWDVPAFDPETVIPRFAGAYDEIKTDIVASVQTQYAEFNLTVLDDDSPLPDPPFSSVYLVHGVPETDDLTARGIAGVARADFYNREKDEDIFVFVEGLAALSANSDVFTNLVANLAVHEIGHALGLLHVRAPGAVMSASLPVNACCTLNSLNAGDMVEFPIGTENPALLLAETLGLKPRDGSL